jgi:CubicO group peptidase (beta-lactamase class C family)
MMNPRSLSLLVFALAAGCGDDAEQPLAPDAGMPDAGTPDAPQCLAPRTPDSDPKVEAIAKILETKWAAAGIPGGALAVMTNNGATIHTVTIGGRAPGVCDAITRDTRFLVGPPTELLTAMAVVAAADKGVFSLNDPITSKLPLQLTGGDPSQIQVRHLLTHSDGLPTTFPTSCPASDLATWFSGWSPQSAWAPPGMIAQWGMNDTQLAGRFLEAATGLSYPQAVKRYLFDPVGASATFDTSVFESGPHALPIGNGGAVLSPSNLECAASKPASGVYASIDDLAKILKVMAWGDTAVMSTAAFTGMTSGNNEPTVYTGDHAGYGLVTFNAGTYNLRYVSGWGGGVTAFVYLPSQQTAFVVTMSKEVSDYEANGINDIIRGLAGTYAPPDTTLPKPQWTQYAGATYTDSITTPSRTLSVTFNGTALSGSMQIGTDPAIPITFAPAGYADMFTASYANKATTVRFWRDGNGAVTRVTGVDWRFGPPLSR